jgi:hypothetical protein
MLGLQAGAYGFVYRFWQNRTSPISHAPRLVSEKGIAQKPNGIYGKSYFCICGDMDLCAWFSLIRAAPASEDQPGRCNSAPTPFERRPRRDLPRQAKNPASPNIEVPAGADFQV